MVLVKRMLDTRLNGYRSPVVPRAPRSIRKRSFREKKIEGTQMCAFDLLATVAGKLLEESACSSASSSANVNVNNVGFEKIEMGKNGGTIKEEPKDNVDNNINKPIAEEEHDDHGSSEGSVCSEKNHDDDNTVKKLSSNLITRDLELDFPLRSDDTNVENTVNRDTAMAANDSFLKNVNDVKKISSTRSNDDDEILSRCSSQPNNITRKIFRSSPPTRVGDRRFRKLLTSKYWKTAPKLKDFQPSHPGGGGAKHEYNNNKRPCYEIDRSQCNTPFKKRRLFDRNSIVTYDGGISCESVSNSPEKSRDDDNNNNNNINNVGKLNEGNGKLSSGFKTQNSCNSSNSQVRLSIKSFKVPELFVEVPESTTIGSLKRTVLEAVTSILGGGLRVGVLLQGKKIRDDNRTLIQSGISVNDDIDTVGFMLEPNTPTQTQPSPSIISPKEPPVSLLCDSPKFSQRSEVDVKKDVFLLGSLDKPSVTDSNSPAASSRDIVPSPSLAAELLEKNNVSDSKALVPVHDPSSMKALAVLPMSQRVKRSEIGQRRTRRPFSVTEVEALVHAVEKLGTGRWRDVKLCSFENAGHRTYVDLKDKWKTLVHTARIAPQQRRGEPVPQELLDRVLAAQAYWSDHQAKQNGKHNSVVIP